MANKLTKKQAWEERKDLSWGSRGRRGWKRLFLQCEDPASAPYPRRTPFSPQLQALRLSTANTDSRTQD
ncbi:hypothetical protein BHE74_00026601 [Ensete ventricosum]|nr:hypothetical protein BHE74_00026601 [Ensete ventricosum]